MFSCRVKVKSKVDPRIGHGGSEAELRYSSALALTSALDGVGPLYPRGRDPVPSVQKAA